MECGSIAVTDCRSPHQPRQRVVSAGELVQIDGSEHAWFEDPAPACTLLAFVDDATSRLMQLRFVASDPRSITSVPRRVSARASVNRSRFTATSTAYLPGQHQRRGRRRRRGDAIRPGADRAEHRHHLCQLATGQGAGRARVRQDRLVKELRLAGISTIEAANGWLPGFIDTYNKRFSRAPANAKDLHRPLIEADNLDEDSGPGGKSARSSHNLTLHYDRMMILLTPGAFQYDRPQAEEGRGGELSGRPVCSSSSKACLCRSPCSTRSRPFQPGAIVENKRLVGAALALVKERQETYAPHRRRSPSGAPAARRTISKKRQGKTKQGTAVAHGPGGHADLKPGQDTAFPTILAETGGPQEPRFARRLAPVSALDPAALTPVWLGVPFRKALLASRG